MIIRIGTKRRYKAIHTVEENAFIIEFDVNNVSGGLHKKYLKFKKQIPEFFDPNTF
ncbi:MAG: hypothetical protein HKN00_09685 [Flavobacteriaceae bacterium]|nr:hypothetical protein [Flavobacteriaceae bacterium]